MSSDEDKSSLPVVQNDSDPGSSVSTDLQEEYEELLRYAIVTPNIESSALQTSHPKGEVVPDVRIPTTTDNSLHNQAGNSPAVRETAMEVGKGCDLNISTHSKIDGSSPVLSPRKSSHPVMDFFSSHLLGDSSSSVSNSTHTDAHEIALGDSLVFDENLQKMENILDFWSSSLKTNILSELSKWRLNFIDWHRMEMKKEKEKHAAHVKQLYNQINDLKELQKTFEVSIGRKDEVYECKLADQYFQRTLLKKTWKGWRSIIQRQWKEVVERACQARAEEVCVQISNDYEAKVAMLSGALENAKTEIQRMQHDKEHFEDSMKKAFMRGVCALNLEAMTMFQNRNDTGIEFTNNKKEEYGPVVQGKEHCIHSDSSMPSIPPMPSAVPLHLLQSSPAVTVGTASATAVPSAVSMTSAGAASASAGAASASSVQVHVPVSVLGAGSSITTTSEEMTSSYIKENYVPRVVTSAHQRAGRTITARITGRCDFASKNRINSSLAIMGVSPPMSSVIVEKHHPVTVQTIPQASAAKYSRSIHPEGNTSASRSLGTRSTHGTQSLTSVQSIKVVD
ncbi:centrosomal protein POC5 isoform X5 [Sciurus carolinensis]|uniref:centrosomal protein POC5 isoform X5 n=1 Tax=Sciurus carolinensis TaxID=30640 RepID=UPI001FB271C8|nr:centrosomal protein POC5 isoform X5 [Sciurus carolinensis]